MSSYDWSVWVPQAARQFMPGLSNSSVQSRGEAPPITSPSEKLSRKVFIVHGHDLKSRDNLSSYLLSWGLEPVVLSEQSEQGMVLIEKFEKSVAYVKYAIVLLTPDDIGFKNGKKLKPRPRQNVILELGYFWGKLGRQKVCCLVKGDVDAPSDMYGIVFLKYKRKIGEIQERIKKELKEAGYEVEDHIDNVEIPKVENESKIDRGQEISHGF